MSLRAPVILLMILFFAPHVPFASETTKAKDDVEEYSHVETPAVKSPDEDFNSLVSSSERMSDGSCGQSRKYIKKGYCCHSGIYYSCRKFRRWFVGQGRCNNKTRKTSSCSTLQKANFLKHSPSTKSKWRKTMKSNSTKSLGDASAEATSVGSKGDNQLEEEMPPLPVKKPTPIPPLPVRKALSAKEKKRVLGRRKSVGVLPVLHI